MPHYASLRFFVLWTAALMVAAAMVSSSALAVALGNAAAQSTLGQPLRVAIPLDAAPGEMIAPDCFSLVRPTGDGPAGIVTAKVSVERAAAVSRLVVTTRDAINEPAIRLAVQGGCESAGRRDYVLLLDPSQAGSADETTAAPAGTNAPAARAPGQEPRAAAAMSAAARRDSPESSGTGARRVAQRPVAAEPSSLSPSAGIESGAGMLATPPSLRSGLRQVAATGDTIRATRPVARAEPSAVDGSTDTWWTIAVAAGGLVAIILGAILVHHSRALPMAPEWSQQLTSTGPRSFTNLSAAPVTLSRGSPTATFSERRDAAVTLPNLTIRSTARSISPPALGTVSKPASASRAQDPSPDVLLDDIEADLVELRSVREAHAAARRDKDLGGNAILKAIEAAERDLMLDAPADTAMDRSLEDDLQVPKRRSKKAAA